MHRTLSKYLNLKWHIAIFIPPQIACLSKMECSIVVWLAIFYINWNTSPHLIFIFRELQKRVPSVKLVDNLLSIVLVIMHTSNLLSLYFISVISNIPLLCSRQSARSVALLQPLRRFMTRRDIDMCACLTRRTWPSDLSEKIPAAQLGKYAETISLQKRQYHGSQGRLLSILRCDEWCCEKGRRFENYSWQVPSEENCRGAGEVEEDIYSCGWSTKRIGNVSQ